MKVLIENCKISKKIRKVEEFLIKNGIEISWRGDGILLDVDGHSFVIREGEGGNIIPSFPSMFDGTRIQPIEYYINGE